MMKVKLREIQPAKATVEPPPRPRWPAWFITSEREEHPYTTFLEENLQNIVQPDELECRDVKGMCPQHTEARDKFLSGMISAGIEALHEAIPLRWNGRGKLRKAKSGWKENMEPQRTDAMYWHGLWMCAGLRTLASSLRRWSTLIINIIIQRAAQRKRLMALHAARLREAAVSGDMDLMKELKRNAQQTEER